MSAVFAGKYTFESTNTSGERYFLTIVSQGSYLVPSVTAAEVASGEAVILYLTTSGNYLVCLPTAGPAPGPLNLTWCSGLASLGILVGTPDPASASEIAISGLDGPSTWSVLDTKSDEWAQLGYIPHPPIACLTYGAGDGYLTTLSSELVSPGYADVLEAKQARGADFSYADLSGLDFAGVDLTGADFSYANLDGTSFRQATLAETVFVGASLDATDLTGANLSGAVFRGANLTKLIWGTGVSAAGADLSNCIMSGCVIGSLSTRGDLSGGSNFSGADMSGANLSNTDLNSAVLLGANLTGADLSFSDLTGARLGGTAGTAAAVLAYAIMQNVTLDQADLFAVDFSFANLSGAGTTINSAATLQQANFSNAYLAGLSFQNSNLQGAVFDAACLVNVNFTGAQLGPPGDGGMAASLAATCLQGANFSRAVLSGTNLANAAVATAPGSIPVRYCTSFGPIPPPPGDEPLNFQATSGLDATTLTPTTICPNGSTFAAGLAKGTSITELLAAPQGPQSWLCAGCMG
ncbi:MAG TPA: pentapeptide repeat-containing protein [Acidimicrobiales bacterium]|nr:pentapeptide repeat-containing protein [Acidimicrobiales bacterium]